MSSSENGPLPGRVHPRKQFVFKIGDSWEHHSGPIVRDDLVQLGVSPAIQSSTILLHLLLDSGAFIEAILADMSWSHMKHVLFVNGGTNIVMATGATIS